jgi:hypothetical protein
VGALAPAALYAPAGSKTSAAERVAPVTGIICAPAAAGVGPLAPAPLYAPAASVVGALAPAALYVPAGSTISAAEEVAPVTGIYVPDAASVGALAPAPLYAPAASVVGALAPPTL